MPISAGTAYLDVVPKLHRDFSKQLSTQMLQPMAKAADDSGRQASRQFGQRLLGGLQSPLRQASGLIAGAFAAKKILDFFTTSIAEGRESNRVAAQTEAVIRSTGGAAKVTTRQVSDLATAISNKTGKDDEAIQAGANMILTFTGIKNAAGKNNDIFNQTVQVTEDMTAAMNGGVITQENMRKTAIAVGKAMNDPIAGLIALRRAGVTFTDQQKEQIKALVQSGDTMSAQKIILAELRKEFGGSAEASATAAEKLRVRWGNFQEAVGNKLIPIIDKAAAVLIRFSDATQGIGPTVTIVAAGVAALGIGVLGTVSKILAAREAWVAYRASKVAQVAVDAELGAAETALAAKTTATSLSVGLLTGRLLLFGGAAAGALAILKGLSDEQTRQTAIIDRQGSMLDRIKDKQTVFGGLLGINKKKTQEAAKATGDQGLKTAYAAKQQELQRLEMVKGLPQFQSQADKVALNSQKADELAKKLTDLRGQFRQTATSVAQTVQSYQGLITKSKVTAREVITDLHNQVANFMTYSRDVQRLIKAGVDPSAIRELSTKGPEYIHALATGSARQLQDYKATWVARNKEVKGDFAASMEAQYKGLVAKIKAMQRQIDSLTGKNIPVSASLKLNFTKDYTQAMWAADRARAGRMAEGGLIRQGTGPKADDVPLWGSKGEFMVNAAATKAYLPYLEWMNAKQMALGGPVGRIDAQTDTVNKIEAFGTGTRLHAGIAAFLAAFGGAAAGFTGGAASGNVIRLALAQARRMAASFKVALALIEAGIVESGLRNLNYGDRDSLGFLQQRPSQGWLHPMNISYAAWDFLRRAIPIQGRYGTAGMLAQAVQRSAFPARYDQQQARALGILHAYGYDHGGVLQPGLNLMWNGTGRQEALVPAGGGDTYVFDFRGAVVGDKQALIRDIRQGIRDAERRQGRKTST